MAAAAPGNDGGGNGGPDVVTIPYADLVASSTTTSSPPPPPPSSSELLDKIGRAYSASPTSLGLLVVSDVPSISTLRRRLLPLARRLAHLPPNELNAVVCEDAGYQVGWSHGREKVQGDKYDTAKGSFYANPLTDDLLKSVLERRQRRRRPPCKKRRTDDGEDGDVGNGGDEDAKGDGASTTKNDEPAEDGNATNEADTADEGPSAWDEGVTDDELATVASDNPAFFAPNVWPSKSIPELEPTLKEMGDVVRNVGLAVARLCDAYVSDKCPGYPKGKIEDVLNQSMCCKARLLHYFAPDEDGVGKDGGVGADAEKKEAEEKKGGNGGDDDDEDGIGDWCGWHNDHGTLTGLVPALFLDADGNEVKSCPDPNAGLYVKSRGGDLVHVKVPPDCLAFQIGETAQVHTGGVLQATPHAVRGCRGEAARGVTRESFAVFMEPEYHGDMDMPAGRTVEDTQRIEAERHLPPTVRTLRSRWKPGMNFGEFSHSTFAAFH